MSVKKEIYLRPKAEPSSLSREVGAPATDAQPAQPASRAERRNDQMSIRMTSSMRDEIIAMSKAKDIPISDLIEHAWQVYKRHA